MRITKTFSGEQYWFYIRINYKDATCTVRVMGRNEEAYGKVSEDGKLITLEKGIELEGRWTTIEQLKNLPRKTFFELKVNKEFQKQIKNELIEWKSSKV